MLFRCPGGDGDVAGCDLDDGGGGSVDGNVEVIAVISDAPEDVFDAEAAALG